MGCTALYSYMHTNPLESEMLYNGKPLSQATGRDVRIEYIKVRRLQNALARRLGFRNFDEWQGGNAP